jgi:hypothetical protein
MNGINDDIYIIYIYNGKNLRIQKGYTVSWKHDYKIKGYRERRSVVVNTTSSQTPLDRVVENFKDSDITGTQKYITV